MLMERELRFLVGAMERPSRPLAAVVGGAKVSSKLPVLKNLLPKVDVLAVGGAMAFTFFKAQGKQVGKSKVEVGQRAACCRGGALGWRSRCLGLRRTTRLPTHASC